MENKNLAFKIAYTVLLIFIVAFSVMKLIGVIECSWVLILAPVWIPAVFTIIIFVIALSMTLAFEYESRKAHKEYVDREEARVNAMAAEYGLQRRPGENNAELKHRIAVLRQSQRRSRHQ